MKKFLIALFALIAAAALSVSVNAGTISTGVMNGTIGKYKIKMSLNVDDMSGKITGWYYYVSKGPKNKIQLSGYGSFYNEDGTTMTEKVNGKVTGNFHGTLWIGQSEGVTWMGFYGTWTSPTGKRLDVNVGDQ